ncbi:hypothetical protein K1T71_001190 [Dendrolimus kikuchii]|uniref:Uncharacterized protein n=1 Tax=Dendrolimus kikuchii TaxID=765133 RepID=A0ACC1DGY8_9NEOP|nr:hypothetical protein K1T71_001190 [Dendrolimus kikuchii]
MAVIALILSTLLVNQINSQSEITQYNVESEVNTLSGASVFATQIRQIRSTSETTPVAPSGNKLNLIGTVAAPTNPLPAQDENFRSIPTTNSFNRRKVDRKYEIYRENENLPSTVNVIANNAKFSSNNPQDITGVAMPIVWDACLETNFVQNDVNLPKRPITDLKYIKNNYQSQIKKEVGNVWNKRNVDKVNNSDAIKAWLEKYNDLKNSKSDERRQQKPELVLIKKISTTIATETPSTTVHIIPITREVFKEVIEVDTTKSIVTESDIRASYTEDRFESKDRSKIKFNGLPQRESYLIPTLKLEEGFHPFSYISKLFYLIYPYDFPVGLIKDIVWGEFSFPYSFLQSIKVESTFLAVIVVFICISLIIPCYLIILGTLALFSSTCDDEADAGALFPEPEDLNCNNRGLVVVTLFVLFICCVFISGMAVSSEQAHAAASESRNFVSCACSDIAAWLTAAARDLYHSLVPPVDLVHHAYKEDLKNVEILLGEPIQQAISSESGIDLVFDSLADIIAESEDLSRKISSLRDVSIKAGAMASAASDRIKDLAKQLANLKKYCNLKDAPLCDTINTNSLEMKIKFDLILHERQLLELRTLGVGNLTKAISIARKEFRTLPSAIAAQTFRVREDILRDIEDRRQAVHASAKILNDIARHLSSGLQYIARRLESTLDRINRYEFARWTTMLACIVKFGFVTLLILLAIFCGCGKIKNHAMRTLKVSAVWLCFTSLILWVMVSAIFLIAGHAEVYVCNALWDSPQYGTLAALMDRPSPLLPNNEGIFDRLFRDLDNVTIDVSVKDVLRDCEKDRPAYIVFQLDKVLDVNKETSYFEWEELQADLGRLASAIDVGLLKTISVNFSKLLNEMLLVSDVTLAKYRMDYNMPVVGKDLPSLIDQLQNIAAQVTDLTTAGRLETLASRTQRLYVTNIKPLEQLRAEVVFKLTELELQLMPFRRKLNISLSHIHTAQFYIDNQGDVIAQKKVSTYVSRLISHAAGWRTHVLVSTGKHAARCKPLFAVYSAARSLLCTKYIASLHGWWVCGFFLGVSWCTTLTPLCVKLWRSYGKKIRAQEMLMLNHISGQQETPTTALCDGSNWNTPGPPAPPPRSDSW